MFDGVTKEPHQKVSHAVFTRNSGESPGLFLVTGWLAGEHRVFPQKRAHQMGRMPACFTTGLNQFSRVIMDAAPRRLRPPWMPS